MKSIKRSGLLQPLIVYDNGEQGENKKYMILAGHNRAEACKAIKMEKVPCLIKKNLTKVFKNPKPGFFIYSSCICQ